MKKLIPFVACAVLGLATAARASAQPADPQGVRKALEAFANAFNGRDAKAAAESFDDKGVFVSALGAEFRGRVEIEKSLVAGFAGPLREARLALTAEAIQGLTPDVALQTDLFYVAGRKDAAGKEEPIRLSHYLMVWVKRPGGWKIAALQTMVPSASTP